jgi:hypothetical protein
MNTKNKEGKKTMSKHEIETCDNQHDGLLLLLFFFRRYIKAKQERIDTSYFDLDCIYGSMTH